MSTPVAVALASRIDALRYADLPTEVVLVAKRLLLDTLLVARAGMTAEGTPAMRALAEADGGAAQSLIWGTDRKVPMGAAALVNTFAGSALDFDSLHRSVHPDPIAVAVALAVAGHRHRSGADFIAAFVVGSEVICRLARASIGQSKGWTHTALYGVFGAAAAAAKLNGANRAQIVHSLGLALSLAAGTQQTNSEQVLAKRLQPAIASRNGIFAATLAMAGITAPVASFEGRFGLWNLYQPGEASKLLDGFGTDFAIVETGLKKYPICACSHVAVDAAAGLARDHHLRSDDIVRIDVRISPFMNRLVGGEFDPSGDAQVTGQFSLRYAIASILLRGRIGIAEIQADAVREADIRPIAEMVSLVIDPGNTAELAPATVAITTRSGEVFTRTGNAMPGDPSSPLSDAEFDAKLAACAAWGARPLSATELLRLRSAVDSIELCDDIGEFVQGYLAA